MTMPSKMSRSRTSSTCSSVPIFVPELLSTGVPRAAAWYEIGVPCAMVLHSWPGWQGTRATCALSGRYRVPRERSAEKAKLGGRAAERELVPLGGGEVPVQQVTGVDAYSAVDVDRGVRDPVAAIGGPEFRRGDLLFAQQARLEPPRCLPHRQPDRLDVDVGVGQPLRDCLERPDRPAELLAVPRVLGGQLERPLGDAQLEGAGSDGGARTEPVRD